MNKIVLLLCIWMVTGLVACYEDKGNYDYQPINEVAISGIEKEYVRQKWDELSIEPKLTFSAQNTDDLVYCWEVDGKVVSDQLNLKYTVSNNIADDVYKCRLGVLNKSQNSHYYCDFALQVVSPYEKGILVLSEQDGKAMLSFRLDGSGSKDFDKWVFRQENHEYLEGNPLSLEQAGWGLESDVMVATSKGNYRLTRKTLKFLKRYDGSNALVKDPDFEMRFCVFTDMVNGEDFGCAIGKNGMVYTFRGYTDFFSTPSLKPIPDYNDPTNLIDYDLSDKCLVYTTSYGQVRRFLGYDNKEGRYMLFMNRMGVTPDVEQLNNVSVRTPAIGLPLLAVGTWSSNKFASFFYDPVTNVAKVVASHNNSFQNVAGESVVKLDGHKFTSSTILKFCDATSRAVFTSGHLIYQLYMADVTAEPQILCDKLPEGAVITCLKFSEDRKRLYVGVQSAHSDEYAGDIYILNAVTGAILETCTGVGGKPVDVIEKY